MTAAPVPPAPEERIPGLRPPTSERTLEDLLAEWLRDESGEQERSWKVLKRAMNETRRESGKPPIRE